MCKMCITMLDIISIQWLIAIIIIIVSYNNNTWIKIFYFKHNKLCRFKWKVFSITQGFWQSIESNIGYMKTERCLRRLQISEKIFLRSKACWTCLCAKERKAENVRVCKRWSISHQKSCESIALDDDPGYGQRHFFVLFFFKQ